MYTVMVLGLALLLVLLNGGFVAAEFSFVKVRRTRLEILADEGDTRARSALFGVTNLEAYLSVCQLGITLTSLGLGWIGKPAIAPVLSPLLGVFVQDNPALLATLSLIIGFTIITFLHVVFGELVPKSLSIQKAEATALLLARPMRFFYVLCFPLVTIMNGLCNIFLRCMGVRPAPESEHSHSPEELRMLIMESSQKGLLDEGERRMLDNIFRFHQKAAKSIMMHRMDTDMLDVNTTPEVALHTARESGHTRFPVYESNSDNIIGFIHIKDLFRRRDDKNLRDIVREPLYVPEVLHLDRLLHLMQGKRQQFCVVVDEFGAWQGILTMEDIVEAIVGDIQDEFDNEEPELAKENNGVWLASGDLSLEEMAEHIPLECSNRDINMDKIIAAHVMETLDRIPEEGDSIELCGARFTVINMDRNRVRRVRVEPVGKTHAEVATDGQVLPQ